MKKLYMLMIIIFSIMICTDVYAIKYAKTTASGGSSMGNGVYMISIPSGANYGEGPTIALNTSVAEGEEIEINMPLAFTFSGNVGNIPPWFAYLIQDGETHTCELSPLYTQNSNIAGAYTSTNVKCRWQYKKTNTNGASAYLWIANYFSGGTMSIRYNQDVTLIYPNLDGGAGGGSSYDYTSYIDQIEAILNTMDTNGDNRYNGIIAYLRTMNTNRENEYNNIINALNSLVSGNTSISTAINNQTQQQQQQNQVINNTDTSQQSTNFESTVENFVVPDTAGIQGVLLQAQQFMAGLEASGHCNAQRIPIPFTEQSVRIPCMTTEIYSVYFPSILVVYQLIIRGIVYYYILVNLLKLFKESIDPFNYRIEVLDL